MYPSNQQESPINRLRITIIVIWAAILSAGYNYPLSVWAKPLSATANLLYDNTETEENSTWNFLQTYNLSFMQECSTAINFNSDFRYNYRMSSEGDDGSQLNPSLNITLRNDLFTASLGATFRRLDYDQQPLRDNWSWDALWFSQWDDKWPSLRLNYNESYSRDDSSPRQQDNKSTQIGSALNYEWRFLECSYDYRLTTTDDYAGNTSSESDYHHATLQLGENWNFWGERASIVVNQRLTYDYNTTENMVGAGDEFFLIARRVSGFYDNDNTPSEGELVENPALTNKDFLTSAGIKIANPIDYNNIGFLAEDRGVNQIKIYFDRELKPSEQHKLIWQAYISEDGRDWFQTIGLPLISYEFDPVNVQTVAIIDLVHLINDYGKVVVRTTETLFDPFYVTELEVGERRIAETDTVKSDNENWFSESSLSLTLSPLDNWTLGANFNYQEDHRKDSDDLDDKNTEIFSSLTSDYYLNRYLWLTLGISENRNKSESNGRRESNQDEIHRSYTAALQANPLDTLDISLIYTHGENFEDGDKTETNDSVNFNLAAQLYPDVSADFSAFWNKSDEESDFNWRFDATARLTEKVNLDLYCDNLDSYGLQVNWRPSDIFSFTSQVDRDDEADTSMASSSLSWIFTSTLRSSLYYSITDSPDTLDHRFSFNCNWIPCSLITLMGNFSYLNSQENGNSLNWNLRLSLRY